MSAFVLAALWACVPTLYAGFVMPKIVLILAGMVFYQLRSQWRSLLFLAVMLVSLWLSDNQTLSLLGFEKDWSYGVLAIICYLLLMTMPTKGNWLKWAGVGLSIHALLQLYGLDPLIPIEVLPGGRSYAWIGSPVYLSAILAMAAPASGRFLPLVLVGIAAAGSRGAILAVAFALAGKKLRIVMLPLLFAPFFLSAPKDQARVEMAKVAWQGFKERPWFGHGPNTFSPVLDRLKTERLKAVVRLDYMQQHAHNDILEALCSTGILGLIAYLLLIWPLRRNASLVALFVVMKFNPVSFEVLAVAALIAANELRPRGLLLTKR